MITVYAFRSLPPIVRGFVRDIRVRWALEEAGLPYEQKLITQDDQKTESYRALQPFGQVPVFEEDGLVLFESGAIVHHIAQRSEALMPSASDVAGRARVLQWMFAALNSIEPVVQQLTEIDLFHADKPWAKERKPMLVERLDGRLGALSRRLDGRDYLEGRFTAADVLMGHVLRFMRDELDRFSVLAAYRKRCEARPAFQKALADHFAAFR